MTWKNTNYVAAGGVLPESFGTTVTVPYTYSLAEASVVPTEVSANAGATLYENVTGITEVRFFQDSNVDETVYNLAGQRVDKNARGLLIINGRKVVR